MKEFVIKGPYRITQRFKGLFHDGLDIVPYYDKNVYSSVNGKVVRAGWENSKNHKQGFGLYVAVRDVFDNVYYFGHLSKVCVKVGDIVDVGDVLGVVGNTGKSTGTHLHYCCRFDADKNFPVSVADLHNIKNLEGIYNQFIVKRSWKAPLVLKTPYITQARKVAKAKKCVIYDEKGRTLFSYR